jgi:hypothetical protein
VLVAAETSRGQSVYGRWPVRDPIGQGKGIRKHVDAIVTGSGPTDRWPPTSWLTPAGIEPDGRGSGRVEFDPVAQAEHREQRVNDGGVEV